MKLKKKTSLKNSRSFTRTITHKIAHRIELAPIQNVEFAVRVRHLTEDDLGAISFERPWLEQFSNPFELENSAALRRLEAYLKNRKGRTHYFKTDHR